MSIKIPQMSQQSELDAEEQLIEIIENLLYEYRIFDKKIGRFVDDKFYTLENAEEFISTSEESNERYDLYKIIR